MDKEQILEDIKKLFEQEKWSKFQLSEYNLKKFQDLDKYIDAINENNIQDEVIELFKEYIDKNEYNLIARYLLAVFSYDTDKQLFFSNFQKIINNFKEREKWAIVEFLARKMYSFEKSEFALSILIVSLKFLNKPQEIPTLQEQYLELDPTNTEIALSLAKQKSKIGDKVAAIRYYKMAIKSFILKKNQKQVEEIWTKLLALSDDKLDWLDELYNLLKANFSFTSIAILYKSLIPILIKNENYDEAIKLLKDMLAMLPDNKEYREELIKVYRIKYANHSKLEDILKSSGLRMWWKEVNAAIELFEKEIKFDVGVYVYHHSWGAGKIVKIEKDVIIVDFEEDSEHKMSLDMALNTLEILPETHIKIVKRYKKDEIIKLAENDTITFIGMVFKSYSGNELSLEVLKSEVTENLLKPSDWQRWWNKAKRELKTSPNYKLFENEKVIRYIESDTSFGEIILTNFNTAADIFEKISITNELIDNDVNKKVELRIYQDITNWFINYLQENIDKRPELSYISYSIIKKLKNFYNKISVDELEFDAKYIIDNVDDLTNLFKRVDYIDYQKMLINDIVKLKDNWSDVLKEIIFTENSKIFEFIIDIFEKNKKEERIKDIVENAIKNYRKYPELFIWISKNILNDNWKKYTDEPDLKKNIIQNLLFLTSYLGRQIKNKVNPIINKKNQQQIIRLLFDKKNGYFLQYVKSALREQRDISSLLNLFRENEYVPKKQKENITAEIRNTENTIVF